ncbi:hypothetical protein [Staphylococcus sp. HMSC074A11]|uniref:hypothetical protein n=1 Tax=Staphylococcus sp. HMSC074A11 TaxID=1715201 RepID=UPI0008A28BB1|nr:hypothetical protein [Staphylococcus sp. HMSC074A11]MCG1201667.1 hypothetical protein [Staphylococcus epidermidis]MCG1206155.1 hypothetical protein [Staphylococcus epidermidis]OFM07511.1 hypothetical protein HMPREF2722_09325 [Staphylococcus sp. HMSC074A11]
MKSHDKTVLISGMMFNAVFFLLMLAELVITKAAGFALFSGMTTYIFFEYVYYAEKKTETHGHE